MSDSVVLSVSILFFWGLSNFVAKIASNLTGGQVLIWDRIGALAVALVITLAFSRKEFANNLNPPGILMGLLVGVVAGVGTYLFYVLLTKNSASWTVAITALYPAVTILLAVLFLHEKLGVKEFVGILLGLASLYFLSGV